MTLSFAIGETCLVGRQKDFGFDLQNFAARTLGAIQTASYCYWSNK